VRTLARCLALRFSRIQFTPDLMPADITGTNILLEDGRGGRRFEFQRGPIFGNVVLADEINRATPKTQSALLEAMQERQVTIADTSYALPDPFWVLATQNPVEQEGVYPLPEAQLDRFSMMLRVGYPSCGRGEHATPRRERQAGRGSRPAMSPHRDPIPHSVTVDDKVATTSTGSDAPAATGGGRPAEPRAAGGPRRRAARTSTSLPCRE
jgi:MoxR-like ATPase